MKKESNDFIRGALWVVRRLYRKLPFESGGGCNCSADLVYYLEDIKTICYRNKLKHKRMISDGRE